MPTTYTGQFIPSIATYTTCPLPLTVQHGFFCVVDEEVDGPEDKAQTAAVSSLHQHQVDLEKIVPTAEPKTMKSCGSHAQSRKVQNQFPNIYSLTSNKCLTLFLFFFHRIIRKTKLVKKPAPATLSLEQTVRAIRRRERNQVNLHCTLSIRIKFTCKPVAKVFNFCR